LAAEGRLLSERWSLYDGSHVVYRPKTLTPEALLSGYHQAFKETFSLASVFDRLWGTTAWKSFFYPMNLGFRQSVRRLVHNAAQAGPQTMREPAQVPSP
jgi:hypothetical protein